MAELDINKTTTTSLDTELKTYSVDSETLDYTDGLGEKTWEFTEAAENLGYYKKIPEFKQAVDALASWTAGKGWTATTREASVRLRNIQGWGEDSFQSILMNMLVIKKVVGDAFAEIIRDDKGDLINLKPISPERMKIVVDEQGLIDRYEQINLKGGKNERFKPARILHLCNNRIADEIHGTSVLEACKWVINARNEAMSDYRKVLHRNVVPVRIIEVDTDNTAERNKLITEYEEAIKKGEVLIIPKGTVEIKEETITIQDPLSWIRYLESFFYQAVGVPQIILGGSQEFTEASSKVGYLTFEQVYMKEQRELETDLLNQVAIEIKLERPVSLKDNLQSDEAKNTGQTGFQPKEAGINLERE